MEVHHTAFRVQNFASPQSSHHLSLRLKNEWPDNEVCFIAFHVSEMRKHILMRWIECRREWRDSGLGGGESAVELFKRTMGLKVENLWKTVSNLKICYSGDTTTSPPPLPKQFSNVFGFTSSYWLFLILDSLPLFSIIINTHAGSGLSCGCRVHINFEAFDCRLGAKF